MYEFIWNEWQRRALSSLIKVMACRLIGIKPSQEPILMAFCLLCTKPLPEPILTAFCLLGMEQF